MTIRSFRLPDGNAKARGHAHGEAFRSEISELAALRAQLCIEQGRFESLRELAEVSDLHLEPLRSFDRDLFDELIGIAEGAALAPWQLVVLNHYTDLKDLDPSEVLGGHARTRFLEKDEDCSAIVWNTSRDGMVLAQTWDMHGSAEPYVLMLGVPAHQAYDGMNVPESWLLTIAGCIGMTGLNSAGVGITINNLKSNDARVGLLWPALVRRVLYSQNARVGRELIESAPLGSGHHYLVADAREAFGIETSGTRHECWAELSHNNIDAGFHHENHCLGTFVRELSSISPVSTTLERHTQIENVLQRKVLQTAGDVWNVLASHDSYPRSVCTHLRSDTAPHAMQTCGGIRMELTTRKVSAQAGCLVENSLTEFAWSDKS